MHVFGFWEQAGVPRENQRRHSGEHANFTHNLTNLCEILNISSRTEYVTVRLDEKRKEKQQSEMIHRLRMRSFKHLHCSEFKHMLGRVSFFSFFFKSNIRFLQITRLPTVCGYSQRTDFATNTLTNTSAAGTSLNWAKQVSHVRFMRRGSRTEKPRGEHSLTNPRYVL